MCIGFLQAAEKRRFTPTAVTKCIFNISENAAHHFVTIQFYMQSVGLNDSFQICVKV